MYVAEGIGRERVMWQSVRKVGELAAESECDFQSFLIGICKPFKVELPRVDSRTKVSLPPLTHSPLHQWHPQQQALPLPNPRRPPPKQKIVRYNLPPTSHHSDSRTLPSSLTPAHVCVLHPTALKGLTVASIIKHAPTLIMTLDWEGRDTEEEPLRFEIEASKSAVRPFFHSRVDVSQES